ncbi:hypothetical protein [Sphingomonas sp. Leaf32]|uniref:hypothetical protein n=2 Tax=Sphingomonas TaxID=13687 RepID=UPI000A77BF3B|nr:hypothetical protein [Sphingomonas sp. Leaf32]
MVEDWGTARERQRRWRRWKWVAAAIAVVALAPLVTTFVLGIVEGYSEVADPARTVHTRDHAGYIAIAIAMLGALVFNLRIWRNADEVERQQMTDAAAITGVVALIALPVLSLAAKPLALSNPAMIGWSLAIAALVVTRIVQRLRR